MSVGKYHTEERQIARRIGDLQVRNNQLYKQIRENRALIELEIEKLGGKYKRKK